MFLWRFQWSNNSYLSVSVQATLGFVSFRFVSLRWGGSKLWGGIKDLRPHGSLIPVKPAELPLMGAREATCGTHEG